MIPKTQSKLPHTGISIFSEMSLLAAQENAVNLSQGFPDFPVDHQLTAYLHDASSQGYNQYAPMSGLQDLRIEIARKVFEAHHSEYDVEKEITVTAGATQAIFTTISCLINPGDEVIIIEPAYDCYEPAVKLFGGIIRYLSLEKPNYSIDWSAMKTLITSKTKLIIINNPNNPSGHILKEEDIQALILLVKNTNIILLSDEVYENICYDQKPHLSFTKYPELKERSFIIASFGKLFHVTGWKLGYVLAPKELMALYQTIHQYNVFSANTPSQYAIAKYMKSLTDYTEISNFYQQKRDYFRSALSGSRLQLLECESTYFQSVDFSSISNLGDKEFCYYLTQNYKVASIPFSAFYHNFRDEKVIRFCFAKKQETLDQAIENILKIS